MRAGGFGGLRARLVSQAPDSLVRLIGELYRLSDENRRYLHSRLDNPAIQLPRYRQLVAEALWPDPPERTQRSELPMPGRRSVNINEPLATWPALSISC